MTRFTSESSGQAMTLQELLSRECGIFGDYLLLSFIPEGEKTKINLTTTGAQPITYSVTVSDISNLDFHSLRFMTHGRSEI
jgi:hypothetical protein